jgi:hypothetical protein
MVPSRSVIRKKIDSLLIEAIFRAEGFDHFIVNTVEPRLQTHALLPDMIADRMIRPTKSVKTCFGSDGMVFFYATQ